MEKPKGFLTPDWIKKMWCIHILEHDSAFIKEGILQYATTWMNLEDSVLSEISQSQEDKYFMILYELSKIDKFLELMGRMVAANDWGLRKWKLIIIRHKFSVKQHKKAPELHSATLYLQPIILYCRVQIW